jgi:hypothetical protein
MEKYNVLSSNVCLSNKHSVIEQHFINYVNANNTLFDCIGDINKEKDYLVFVSIEDNELIVEAAYIEASGKDIDCVFLWNTQEVYVAGLYNENSLLWVLDPRMKNILGSKFTVNEQYFFSQRICIDKLPKVLNVTVFDV